ncbi:MAG: hypothetical protein IKE69_08690 [Thermoguttaceae bacterium]|nr:hypothetical protein [Thermoguttaceae bacterium]
MTGVPATISKKRLFPPVFQLSQGDFRGTVSWFFTVKKAEKSFPVFRRFFSFGRIIGIFFSNSPVEIENFKKFFRRQTLVFKGFNGEDKKFFLKPPLRTLDLYLS